MMIVTALGTGKQYDKIITSNEDVSLTRFTVQNSRLTVNQYWNTKTSLVTTEYCYTGEQPKFVIFITITVNNLGPIAVFADVSSS